MKTTHWRGLYRDGWKGEIVPDAFTHPAKFSRALVRKIYEHCAAEGWAQAGDCVIDPFGGVALGALDAMRLGLQWTGVELESRFADLGAANIALWNGRYADHFTTWGSARLINGDSRNLAALVGAAGLAVSSPPYASSLNDNHYGDGIDWTKAERTNQTGGRHQQPGKSLSSDYGTTPGNLGKMLDRNFELVVSSPPYADGSRQEGNDKHPERMEGTAHAPARYDLAVSSPPFSEPGSQPIGQHQGDRAHYAKTGRRPEAEFSDGNLGGLAMSNFELAVSSPPFGEVSGDRVDPAGRRELARSLGIANAEHITPIQSEQAGQREHSTDYGATPGQLGRPKTDFELSVSSPPWDAGAPPVAPERVRTSHSPKDHGSAGPAYQAMPVMDDFWTAARAIVEQTYAVLAPGGHACWVVKDFVRNKKRVEFSDQWRQLCEAVGFTTIHCHRAWVVEHRGTQYDLAGAQVTTTVERKSFFRRLAEKKGSPRIDWETVYCMVKL